MGLFNSHPIWSKFGMELQNVTGRNLAGSNKKHRPRGQQQRVKPLYRLVKTSIETTFMDRFEPYSECHWGWFMRVNVLYHLRVQYPGVKIRFRWVKSCIKATFMDRFNPNLPWSFGITLWRFQEVQLFCITREVKTRFRSIKACIEATFMYQFEQNLSCIFGIHVPLGMIYEG
jgi:hypothetical protein